MPNIFKFSHVADDQPMTSDPFYLWLQDNNTAPAYYRDAARGYLGSLGMDLDHQIIEPSAAQTLRYVYDHYCRRWTPIREPRPLAELLTEVPPGTPGAYWLNTGRPVVPSADVIAVLAAADLVGGHGPENVHFELRGDLLRVVYAQIMGHRNICRVTDQGGDHV